MAVAAHPVERVLLSVPDPLEVRLIALLVAAWLRFQHVVPHFDLGQIEALLVDALLGLVRHALPISQAVDQNGVESHQDELTDKDAGSETLHSLLLLECESDTDWNGYEVVAR